jgi:hypothetical protein
LGAHRLSGLHVSPSSRPPSPPRSLQKAHPREADRSRHNLTLSMSEQSSRTTSSASSAPRHRHGPQSAAARPSWTPAHVDHRLNATNLHVPDLSRYIRDRSDPKKGVYDQDRSFASSLFCSISAPRAEQPREGHQELLHRFVVFLLSNEGEGSTGGEAILGSAPSDPLPNLSVSPLHSVVTP